MTSQFDVFLSHNSKQKPIVKQLLQKLVKLDIVVWYDEEQLRPGVPWMQLLEDGINDSKTVAVLVGRDGLGPWEDEEMQAALQLAVREKRPVIPVLLPGSENEPKLPMFLGNRMWVDMRAGFTQEALEKLKWGITGSRHVSHALELPKVQSSITASIEFTLDRPIDDFNESNFIRAFTNVTGIEPSLVRIASVRKGSTIVRLEGTIEVVSLAVERLKSASAELEELAKATGLTQLEWSIDGNNGVLSVDFRLTGTIQAKVVFPLHGIRTRGEWVRTASNTLAEDSGKYGKGWACRLEGWDYGYFNSFQFMTPWSRSAKVEWFRRQYTKEMDDRQVRVDESEDQFPSIIAHSFGTYIVGNALLKYKDIRFNKIILVGSILPRDFPWKALMDRGQVRAIRNEYGVDDIWTVVSSWIVLGTGSSGRNGFLALSFPDKDARFEQEEFLYKHSDYFDRRHIRENWRPFLESKTVPITLVEPVMTLRHVAGEHRWSQRFVALLMILLLSLPLVPIGMSAYSRLYPRKQLHLIGPEFQEKYFTAQKNNNLQRSTLRNGVKLDESQPLRIFIAENSRPTRPSQNFKGKMESDDRANQCDVMVSFLEPQDLRPLEWIEVSGNVTLDGDFNPQISRCQIQNQHLIADGCKVFRELRDPQNPTYKDSIFSESAGVPAAPFTWVRWRCQITVYDRSASDIMYACPIEQNNKRCVEFSLAEGGPMFCTGIDAKQGTSLSAEEIVWITGKIVKCDGVRLTLDQVSVASEE
ncbi:MAG: toll/interleukin-1 receptor domain-containing protein [Planctomycetaceae bacterium]